MSRGTKVKINLDKVEICYVGSKELIDNIEDTKHWDRDHYYLEYEDKENKDKRETILSIYVDDFENDKVKFGTLKFGNSFENDNDIIRYCWLRIENRISIKYKYSPAFQFIINPVFLRPYQLCIGFKMIWV